MISRHELLTPAKINLFLRVVGRRADGYHELDSVFLPISLFDRVTIAAEPVAEPTVELRCNWPELPDGMGNLAVRAAARFMEHYRLKLRVLIELHKEIPAGAGLGGGSSDAAAVLRLLARLTGADPEPLPELALRLGADVPFFLDPHPARVGGIGERITYLGHPLPLHLAIAVPPVAVSTPAVFGALTPRQWSGPLPAPTETALAAGEISRDLLGNDLEAPAIALHPVIGRTKAMLQELGGLEVAMSGSGGAVFGIFADERSARRAACSIQGRTEGIRAFAVRVLTDMDSPVCGCGKSL